MVRILLKTKYVSLANLILDKPIFDELLQENFTVKKVFARVERLVGDESYRSAMRADYAKLRTMLGGSGASMRVAREMVDSLKASFEE
jgi:lipid-A-disaccharide synthase